MTTLPNSREPLIRYLTTQAKLDSELSEVLRDAARDTERKLLSARGIRAASLDLVLRDVRRIQHEMWVGGVGPAIGNRLTDAETAASRSARALDAFLASVLGERRAQAISGAFSRRVQRGLQVDASRVPQQLSDRVYRNAALFSGKIERIIRSNVIRGTSARELAGEVRSLIDPRTRGGVSYAATRLGRTELNAAFHRQQVVEADREWVRGVRWNLSRSHPGKDACDALAKHDDGLGAGVWEKRSVPDKPHPQCMCYLTYDLMSEDEVLQLIAFQAM